MSSGFCYNMGTNKDDITRLEKLARLELSDGEREKLIPEINEVIEYFNALNKLDTDGIEPLGYAPGLTNVMREDEIKPSLSAEEITSNAKTENGFFAVPVSIEGEE